MELLSDRIKNLAVSETILMAKESRRLRAEGHNVVDLSLGLPDFDTPDNIKDAAKQAIDDNITKYPPVPGFPELRKAISDKFKTDNQLDYSPEQIVVSTGAKQSLSNIILSVVNPGHEVIMPAPYWVSYKAMVQLAEGKIVSIPTQIENDFKITPDQLKSALTPQTRVFIFSSPCNPTGSVYTREELKGLAEVLREREDVLIIADEIYEYINFLEEGHTSIGQFEEVNNRVATVNGVSKGFAMTGWRIGYMGGPLWLAQACDKMQGQFTSGANTIAQMAAKAALEDPEKKATKMMKTAFKGRRDLIIQLLNEIPGIKINEPEGAFYLFPDVSSYIGKRDGEKTIQNVSDLCMYLLQTVYVACVTGRAFGDENCIRISYATSDENLQEAAKRLKEALSKLN